MSDTEILSEFSLPESFSEESSQPKHARLRDYVAAQIESGLFKAGILLPSEYRIAERLQVARSTVRQAMATLEREGLVRRVHGKGTFVHDQARQRLSRGQNIYALIVPETETGFYPSLQKSFEEAAGELHSQVIVCNSGNEIDRQGCAILQLIDLQVAGVAIVPTTNPLTPAYHLRQLQQHGIPVVCCSRPVEEIRAPLLAIPFEDVGRRAGEVIRQHGHLHVAFFSGILTDAVKKMERGFQDAMGAAARIEFHHGKSTNPNVAAHESEVSAQLDKMLGSNTPPTAIFATFDTFAELIYVLLSRKGLRVPEDISLIGFGGSRRVGALTSRLTSITINEVQMGQRAIHVLSQIRNGTLPFDYADFRSMEIGLSEGQTLQGPRCLRVREGAERS